VSFDTSDLGRKCPDISDPHFQVRSFLGPKCPDVLCRRLSDKRWQLGDRYLGNIIERVSATVDVVAVVVVEDCVLLADSSEDVEEEEPEDEEDDDDDDDDEDGEVDTSVDETPSALISDQNSHDLSYYRFSTAVIVVVVVVVVIIIIIIIIIMRQFIRRHNMSIKSLEGRR